jgi:predicted transcriptional regulator
VKILLDENTRQQFGTVQNFLKSNNTKMNTQNRTALIRHTLSSRTFLLSFILSANNDYKDYSLLGYDAVSTGKQLPTLRKVFRPPPPPERKESEISGNLLHS